MKQDKPAQDLLGHGDILPILVALHAAAGPRRRAQKVVAVGDVIEESATTWFTTNPQPPCCGSPARAGLPWRSTRQSRHDPRELTLRKGPRKGGLFERRPGVTLPAVAHHVSGHYRLPRNFPGDGRFASTARAPDLPSESPCDAIPCRKVSRGLAGACTRFRLAGVHRPQEGPIYRKIIGLLRRYRG